MTGKVYLGDAVYAECDGWGVYLTTEDGGVRATNRIYLEPEVIAALEEYIRKLRGKKSEARA